MEPTSQSDTRCDKAGGAFEPHATCTHTPFLLRSEAVHHQHHRAGRRRCPEHRVPEPRPRSAGDGPEHAEQQLRAEGQLERQEVICRRPNGQQQLGTVQSWTQVSEKGGAAALSNSSPTFLGRWVAGCRGGGRTGVHGHAAAVRRVPQRHAAPPRTIVGATQPSESSRQQAAVCSPDPQPEELALPPLAHDVELPQA